MNAATTRIQIPAQAGGTTTRDGLTAAEAAALADRIAVLDAEAAAAGPRYNDPYGYTRALGY